MVMMMMNDANRFVLSIDQMIMMLVYYIRTTSRRYLESNLAIAYVHTYYIYYILYIAHTHKHTDYIVANLAISECNCMASSLIV